MRDVEYNPHDESAYECFDCGTIVTAESCPRSCPDCSGAMRNRLTTFE